MRAPVLLRPLDGDCTLLAQPDVTMSPRPGTAFRAQVAKAVLAYDSNSWPLNLGSHKEH
jgi:hypothetical protein